MLTAGTAEACAAPSWFSAERARDGDLVVTGYVSDVREVIPPEAIARYDAWRAANPNRPPHEGGTPFPHLQFTLEVIEVIKGRAPSEITVNWYRGLNNGHERRLRGGYLMVLGGPEGNQDGRPVYRVQNTVCTGGIVLRRGSSEANAVRELFGRWPEPLEPERPTPGEIWERSWQAIVPQILLGLGAVAVIALLVWPRPRAAAKSEARRDGET